jgi:hypothetical protein
MTLDDLAILFGPFSFLALKIFNHLAIRYFGFEGN